MKLFGKSSPNKECKVNSSLSSLSNKLFSKSKNYQISFSFIKVADGAGSSLDKILTQALDTTIEVGGSMSISTKLFYEEISDKISHQGDHGAHPNLPYIKSGDFTEDLSSLLSILSEITESADLLLSFWLMEGHPFYPVFWDFGYLIESEGDSYIFIGSCSD